MRLRLLSCGILVVCLASAVARAEDREATAPAATGIDHAVRVGATGPFDSAERCEQLSKAATELPSGSHAAIPREAAASRASPIDGPRDVEPATSLVARQGLLVPAAFLAAATALSSLIVYAIRGRGVAASPSHEPPVDAPRPPEPAAH